MQITESIIERIARRVFNSMFAPALRQSNVQGGGAPTSVRYAEEAGHASSADSVAWAGVTGKPSFAAVATSGSYNDLSNKPSIPTISNVNTGYAANADYAITAGSASSAGYATNAGYATSAGNADTVDGYHESAFLHLTGGTMSGTLKVATGYGISDATDNGLLVYHPVDWTGVTSSQWGVGAVDCEGVIRSSNNALKHYRYNDGTYEIIDSKGGQTIANSLQIAFVKIEQTNEVNSYQGALHLNYRVASDVTACIGGGNFGIGTTSPSHKLHVVGRIYCTGGFAFLSDIRKKDVIAKDLHISVGDIAKAPLIRYTLKGDEKKEIHIGSVAQYWQNVMPETVNKDIDGTLSMDYGTISLVSVVTLARKLETMEKELSDIKKKLITK